MAVDDFRMIRTEHRLSRNDVLATEGATVDVISILQAMPAEYLPQDTLETTLTQDNVSANAFSNYFGKLFDLPVDDLVYAQILYASGVPIGGSSVNVIYVATVNNTVYAFNADTGGPVWTNPANLNNGFRPPTTGEIAAGCART